MKRFRGLTFLLFLFPMACIAQNFEGEIEYQVHYTSRMASISDTQLSKAMGDKSTYFTSAGNYKSVSNGTVLNWQLYIHAENKIYNKFANGHVQWINAWTDHDSVFNFNVKRNAATIMGYTCDELTLFCRSGLQIYYYSSRFKMDPKLFAKHRYGNYAAYLAEAGAIPLKFIVSSKELKIEEVAVGIKPQKLDPGVFTLPQGIAPTPSPEN
jgi:hypothetical protein